MFNKKNNVPFEQHSLNVKGSGAAAVHDRIKAAMKNFAELINP